MTNKSDFEKLSAYIDGETPPDTTVELERKLFEQESLRAEFLKMKAVDSHAKTVFGDRLKRPGPNDHIAFIDQAFAKRQTAQYSGPNNRWLPAIAASIVAVLISVGIGFFAFDRNNDRFMTEIAATRLAASQELAILLQKTLETHVSGNANEYTDPKQSVIFKVVPLHTYKSSSGHWCREFEERIETKDVTEIRKGLACREAEGQWRRLSTTIEGDGGGRL